MPEKQKARSWKEIQTVIAAVTMMCMFALCNLIASFDRREVNGDADSAPSSAATPTPPVAAGITPAPTQAVTSTGSS